MPKYIITEETLNSIVQYLASRPYFEVAEGIKMLSNLEKLQDLDE
jgi:hypothetical protein